MNTSLDLLTDEKDSNKSTEQKLVAFGAVNCTDKALIELSKRTTQEFSNSQCAS